MFFRTISINNTFSIVFISVLYYVLLFVYPYSYNYVIEINNHYLFFLITLICFLLHLVFQIAQAKVLTYNFTDILFTILLSGSFLFIALNNASSNLTNEYFTCCLIMLMLYFVIKSSSILVITKFLPVIITAFFLLELYLGFKQIYLNDGSSNLMLDIQGSLNNSGIYSIFLVANLPLFSYTFYLLRTSKRIKVPIIILFNVLILYILIITKSRTATLMLGGFWFYSLLQNNYRNNIFKKNKKNFLILLVILFGVYIASASFFIKQASSFGRLLIWQVTTKHIADNFFVGTGIGNFPFYYPKWQIQYVSTHNLPTNYFLNADEVHVAFNEFLQIFSETGILGFLLFTTVLVYILKVKSKENKDFISTTKILVLLIIAACFASYPLHCNSIFFLLIFCIAALSKVSSTKTITFKPKAGYRLLILTSISIVFGIVILKSAKQTQTISNWETVREDFFLEPSQIKKEYKFLYPSLNTNGKFLLDYGERLSNVNSLPQAAKILEESKHFYVSYRTFLSTADVYL